MTTEEDIGRPHNERLQLTRCGVMRPGQHEPLRCPARSDMEHATVDEFNIADEIPR